MPVRIQRKREKGWRMPAGAVYVGRPSKWGNPYRLKDYAWSKHPTAPQQYCMDDFKSWLLARDGDYQRTGREFGGMYSHRIKAELRGKDLACWCPLAYKNGKRVPCHADVLLEIANS